MDQIIERTNRKIYQIFKKNINIDNTRTISLVSNKKKRTQLKTTLTEIQSIVVGKMNVYQ